MSMERRLQILLDEDRHRRITSTAKERGISVAAVIREAIDRGIPDAASKRAAAGRLILEAEDMPVPEDLLTELDELRGRRLA